MTVYVGARDLAGLAFIGTHQFIAIVPDNKNFKPVISPLSQQAIKMIDLGKGNMGLILAGHSVAGRLQVKLNETSDVKAAKEHFTDTREIVDWDAEFRNVRHNFADVDFIK